MNQPVFGLLCCTGADCYLHVLKLRIIIFFLYFYVWLCWVFIAARGLSLVAGSGGHSLVVGLGLLLVVASLIEEHSLSSWWFSDLVAPRHAESSWIRDQTHVSCIGKQILLHWTTREVPHLLSLFIFRYQPRSQFL